MTVLALIVLVVASIIAGYYASRLTPPWPMVVYAVIVVVWLLILIYVAGIDGGLLGQRVS